MAFYCILYFFTTLFLGVPVIKIFLQNKNHDNLIFLILCNAIFMISTTMFYFQANELLLAFFSSIFLFIYAILLIHNILKEKKDNFIFVLPYLCYTTTLLIDFFFLTFF